MDPTIHYSDFYLGDEQVKNGWVDKKIDALVSAGAKWQGLTLDMGDTIQPRFQANVHQKDFSEDQFSKKTRQMLRTARNKGIVTRKVGLEGVEEFARLMELTEERKGVKLRSGEHGNYYRTLLETYGDNAFILLAELNLKDLYEKTLARFNENEAAIAKLKDNQVKKRHNLEEQKVSLTREVTELKEKVERLGEKVIIAGTLTIVYGHTSEILYAGMDDDYKRYMPAYLTWFATIAEAFNMGARTSNMGGLDGHLNDGLLQFKNNFHPVIEEFAGEFDLPVNKLFFKFSETAYKIRKHKK
jgi:serine/alanine adding enzyme